MKIAKARIQNFRAIEDVEISFEDERGEPRRITCLTGDNGSGKTSVLQAIAWTISVFTGNMPSNLALSWPGFLLPRIMEDESLESLFIHLELCVSDEEHRFISNEWLGGNVEKQPNAEDRMSGLLGLNAKGRLEVSFNGLVIRLGEPGKRFRPWSARFVNQAESRGREKNGEIGLLHWFDQHRMPGTNLVRDTAATSEPSPWNPQRSETLRHGPPQWDVGIGALRDKIIGYWTYHKSDHKRFRDVIEELKPLLRQVFPDLGFSGVEPRFEKRDGTPSDEFFFMLSRGDRIFDIAELSSGEQAVFEILYDFARHNVKNAVILIDELELHLHPPQQQALLSALRKIGKDCQFIITSHSQYIINALPREQIIRLKGGRVVD